MEKLNCNLLHGNLADKDAVFDSKHFSPYDKRTSLEDIQRFCHGRTRWRFYDLGS